MRQSLLLLIVLPSFAFAWGETGHRVVCQIAYDELLPQARVELDRLLRLDPDFESFADSCLFADHPERIRWQDHFVNIARSTLAITTANCPLAETCVLRAIESDRAVLLDPQASDADKLLALKLLGHWVGDVHQPMHVSFQDDRGANSVSVDLPMEYPNLHSVWDYSIIVAAFGDDYRQIATRMGGAISDKQRMAWQHDSAIEWANESFQITIAATTGYCVQQQGACWYSETNMMLNDGEERRVLEVGDDYLQSQAGVVELRLQQAGVRLARMLNESLSKGKQ